MLSYLIVMYTMFYIVLLYPNPSLGYKFSEGQDFLSSVSLAAWVGVKDGEEDSA